MPNQVLPPSSASGHSQGSTLAKALLPYRHQQKVLTLDPGFAGYTQLAAALHLTSLKQGSGKV